MAPRTAMQVMAEQQTLIKAQAKRAEAQDASLGNMLRIAKAQQEQIDRLTRGLQAISVMAGVEHRVASAMGLKLLTADVQNPAEPVPEPPAVPPTESTVETKTPEAKANVQDPGLVPGSTTNVPAAATTTNYTPGMDIAGPAFKNLQDVTAPIEGTQTQRPLNETKTETDVRVGDPMNPQTAFPMTGDFANAQRTASVQKTAQQIAEEASLRTMASLHLAKLRKKAGIEQGMDLDLQHRIQSSNMTYQAIKAEIDTLDQVIKRQASVQADHNPRLVPRSASGRQAPPLGGAGQRTAAMQESDEDLFL